MLSVEGVFFFTQIHTSNRHTFKLHIVILHFSNINYHRVTVYSIWYYYPTGHYAFNELRFATNSPTRVCSNSLGNKLRTMCSFIFKEPQLRTIYSY